MFRWQYMLWYHCFILLYYYYYYLNYYIMRYVMVNVYNVRLRNTMWVLREYEREMHGRPSFSVDEHEYFTDMSGAFSWISWGRLWYRKWKRRMKEYKYEWYCLVFHSEKNLKKWKWELIKSISIYFRLYEILR